MTTADKWAIHDEAGRPLCAECAAGYTQSELTWNTGADSALCNVCDLCHGCLWCPSLDPTDEAICPAEFDDVFEEFPIPATFPVVEI